MQIGNIELPAVNVFRPSAVFRSTENIYPFGSHGVVVAEFEPDLPGTLISGYLLQKNASSRTLHQLKEDAESLIQRTAGHNYVHSINGRSGWLACSSVDVEDNIGSLWPIAVSGQWFDKANYVMKYSASPITRSNDFGITGDYKLRIPSGYSASADDVFGYNLIDTEDGDIIEIDSSDIMSVYVEIDGADLTTYKCKCYDGIIQVYSRGHVFAGQCSISNGLYKIIFDGLFIYLRYWDGNTWQVLGTVAHQDTGTVTINEITNDKIVIKKGQTVEVDMEIARVPHIRSTGSTRISGASDGETDTNNYLTVGTNKYVASTVDFSILDTYISCSDMWFFYAGSGVSTVAANAIVKSNLTRQVVVR